jgi:hypothetical protein
MLLDERGHPHNQSAILQLKASIAMLSRKNNEIKSIISCVEINHKDFFRGKDSVEVGIDIIVSSSSSLHSSQIK